MSLVGSPLRRFATGCLPRLYSSSPVLDPVQEALLTEPCILVDSNDRKVGQASKRECHLMQDDGTSLLHRAFSLFIFNEKEELLLQQRSSSKITFPNMWTNTCCSHPLAVEGEMEEGEGALGVRRAAQRRVEIELGVDNKEARPEDILYLTRILYAAPSNGQWGEHELDYILFLRSRSGFSISPNLDEVQATEWVRREDLKSFLMDLESKEVEITPWFKLISQNMLPLWWDNLKRIERYQDHSTIHKYY